MTKLVKEILELYGEVLKKETTSENCDDVADVLKTIRAAYVETSRDRNCVAVDYNEANCRYAYIYYYSVCHTIIVSRQAARILIQSPHTFCDIMGYEKKELEICSLGGGPGCDLIGLLRLRSMAGLGETKKINCTVLDICSGWQHSLKNVLSTYLNTSEGSIYKNKLRFELIKTNLLAVPPRLSALLRVAKSDVLTLVKFVSAVPSETTAAILELLFSLLKPGAYVLFLDNVAGSASKTTAEAAAKAGLLEVCPLVRNQEDIKKSKIRSIGPTKMSLRPLKSTHICSAVWQKL